MSSVIKVPYAELYNRSSKMSEQVDLVRSTVTRVDNTVRSLEWMGNAATKFQTKWESAAPEMHNWANIVEAFAKDMYEQAKVMDAADNS